MPTPGLLINAVRSVLRTQARAGRTTKNDATIMVMRRIENAGGPTRFGLGAAAMRMALAHLVGSEVTRQFKSGLSEHAVRFVLPQTTPVEIIEALGKIPAWIAIEEGEGALWIYALRATPDDWRANANIKEKKAQQTTRKANESIDIARYLLMNGFGSLGDAMMPS
jgi:hypothetical protein